MHSVVMKTGVLPMYDEDGNEIYAILTPYQQKEFNKMVARSQKILEASFENAKLQDFEESEVNQEVVLEDAKNEEEPEKTDDLEQGDDLGDDYEEYDVVEGEEVLDGEEYDEPQEESLFDTIGALEDEPQEKVTLDTFGYEEYDVKNPEYFEMHPEDRDATFVKQSLGLGIEAFVKSLVLLQKDAENKIIGVYNGVPLDASKHPTVAELIAVFNKETNISQDAQEIDPQNREIREKGEFLDEGRYYKQFYTAVPNSLETINQFNEQSHLPTYSEHTPETAANTVIKMNENCPDVDKFLEAAMYTSSANSGKTYIDLNGLILCASEFESQEELHKKVEEIQKVQAYNKELEAHPEKYPGKEKKDIFIHSNSYYKSLISIDKNASQEQVRESGNPKARVLKAAIETNYQQLAEAGRYFGARNPNIYIKGLDEQLLNPSEFSSIEELENAYSQNTKQTVTPEITKNIPEQEKTEIQDRAIDETEEEKPEELLNSKTNGIDMTEVDSTLAALTLETLEQSKNGVKIADVAKKLEEDAAEILQLRKEIEKDEKQLEEIEEKDDEEYPGIPGIPEFPEER